jgi:hypothetical protein
VAQGSATITATGHGVSGRHSIQVWQDYQGTWTGSYRIRVCSEQGDFAGALCASSFSPGSVYPVRVTLTQDGGSASGTIELGSIVDTLSGGIFDSRHFVGAASGSFGAGGITFNNRVGTFDALSTGASLTGSLINTITAPGYTGNAYFEADLSGVTRTSSMAAPHERTNYFSLPAFLRGFQQ